MGAVPLSLLVGLFGAVACGRAPALPELAVVGTDYAFVVPDSVHAGETAVSFTNRGTVRHEVKVIAIRAGVSLDQVLPLAMVDSAWAEFREPTSGILTAGPGQTTPGRLLIDFQRDRTYLLICSFADSDTSALHSEMGMIRVLTVR